MRLTIAGTDGTLLLVAELTGRGANLLVLNAKQNVLRALRHFCTRPPQARRDAPLPEETYEPPLGGPWIATILDSHAATRPVTQGFPISEEMERRYEQQETEREQATLQQARLGKLRKAVKKTARRLESLTGDLVKAARYRDYARYGELLKARLRHIAKGQDRIAVIDYFDPALSPSFRIKPSLQTWTKPAFGG